MPNLDVLNHQPPGTVTGPYYGRKEAAAYLGISVRNLDRRCLEGSGPPACVVGWRKVFPVSLLDEYMAARLVTSTAGRQTVAA